MNRKIAVLAASVAAAMMIGGTAAAQQSAAVEKDARVPAAVILSADYPAFQDESGPAGRVPLRAIVFFQGVDGRSTPVVLVNPRYATPHTLYEAFSVLIRPRTRPDHRPDFVALGVHPRVREPTPDVARELQNTLTALRQPGAAQSTLRRLPGAMVSLPDVRMLVR
ncbi:MAG TPA: hypothetical protein VK420_15920 [Longimicrobium sp.]|nr:hypothetical protein [Longimicrobium sp.]